VQHGEAHFSEVADNHRDDHPETVQSEEDCLAVQYEVDHIGVEAEPGDKLLVVKLAAFRLGNDVDRVRLDLCRE
jgi:hypothetical protein